VPIPELESSYFVSEIEDFTLKLDISAAAAALGVSANNRDLAAQVRRCDGSSFETTDTIFTLRQMLAWACIDDLDAASDHAPGESYRYAGGVLVVVAKFSNTVSLSGRHMLEMSSTLIPRTEFKATTTISSADMSTRTVLSMHGIFITVEIAGEFGIFSLPTLVVQLTASLGLLAMAKKLVYEILWAVFFFFFFFSPLQFRRAPFKLTTKTSSHTHTHTHTHTFPTKGLPFPSARSTAPSSLKCRMTFPTSGCGKRVLLAMRFRALQHPVPTMTRAALSSRSRHCRRPRRRRVLRRRAAGRQRP
jgi:hypothetical protein